MPIELDTAGAAGGNMVFGDSNMTMTTNSVGSNVHRAARLNTTIDASLNWYWEVYCNAMQPSGYLGVGVDSSAVLAGNWYTLVTGYMYYGADGETYWWGASPGYGSPYNGGCVIGVQVRGGKLYFYRNGVIQKGGDPVAGTNFAYSGLTGNFYPTLWLYAPGSSLRMIVKQGELIYPLPSGASSIDTGGTPLSFAPIQSAGPSLSSAYYAGLGHIAGTLKINGVAAEGYVTLRHRRSGIALQRQWATGGNYRFDNLSASEEYDVIARDPLRGYKDYIEPAVVPTL